jgi:hypothetical protein
MITRSWIIQRFTRLKFTLFRCTSADLFFSCCGSVAALQQRPGHRDQVPAKNNERRRGHRTRRTRIIRRCTRLKIDLFSLHISRVVLLLLRQHRSRGNGLGTTTKCLRKTTSGAAGIGLGTTIKYPRRTTGAAAGNGLGTTLSNVRGATGNGLGTTLNYLHGAAGNGRAQVLSNFSHNECRRGQRPGHHNK